WARVSAAIERSMVTGEGYELELTMRRHDGETRVVMARAMARMHEGRVTHLLGTLHDVTELAHAHAKATSEAERSRLARQSMGLGIWDYDLRTGATVWDDQMRALYGMPADAPIDYERWTEQVFEEDRELLADAAARAIEQTGEFDVDFRIRGPGIEERTIHGVAHVVRASDGTALRMVGLNRDVTAERAHEAAARERYRLVEQFVRETPAAIAMFDDTLHVQITSERFRSDFGLRDDSVGAPLEAIFTQPERWRRILAAALEGEVQAGEEEPFEVAKGRLEWLTWEARPRQGETGGVTLFTHVVTERRMLRAQIEKGVEELRRSNRDLEEFAYAASHDLQEPLRAVSGCAQMFEAQYAGKLDAQADELLHHMVDGADRMRALITGLLAYARVTSRGSAPELFPARETVDHALANLRVAIEEGGAEVSVGASPEVEADRSQLTTVFQNLVGNALKYRRGDRVRVHVDAVDGGEEWIFSVRDDGIGIEPRYHQRIFELFQRLHTRADYPGTGIGLALCVKIVERHGGRMWVDSSLGVGSTFCFALPKHAAPVDGGFGR
ncbi:MAG: PAS domain-containing protein, partial [Myxococcales bacterium]|nr:PAS domain-containing protein [Myxococcales bacterium]